MTGTPNLTAEYAQLAEHRQHVLGAADGRLTAFRETWLPRTVSAAELAALGKVPASYLIALYPRLYMQGPNAFKLARIVEQVTALLFGSAVSEMEKERFVAGFWHTYRNRWGAIEDEGEWDALHDFLQRMCLGDAVIYTTDIVKPDADYLHGLCTFYFKTVASPRMAKVYQRAVTGFAQMILVRDLVEPLKLRCDRFEEYEPEDASDEVYDEFEPSYTEPLYYTEKVFQAHDLFMQEWGLS